MLFPSGIAVARHTLSIARACAEVGVARRTMYDWMHRGKVEYVRTAGGSVRIFADTLFRAEPVNSHRGRRIRRGQTVKP